VPEVLTSGDHARIKTYRFEAALEKCRRNRPDLAARIKATDKDAASS
jgi:tRNA (guanine-N1)-methyltransferase